MDNLPWMRFKFRTEMDRFIKFSFNLHCCNFVSFLMCVKDELQLKHFQLFVQHTRKKLWNWVNFSLKLRNEQFLTFCHWKPIDREEKKTSFSLLILTVFPQRAQISTKVIHFYCISITLHHFILKVILTVLLLYSLLSLGDFKRPFGTEFANRPPSRRRSPPHQPCPRGFGCR